MARVIVFDLNNAPVGEFSTDCNRGWILLGNTGVSDGGETTVSIPTDIAVQPWLQLGRMVLVEQPPLPAWAGVIDMPWKASLPVEMTFYNAEYLFSLRSAERSVRVNGPMASVIAEMIRLANEQEPMYISLGNTSQVQDQFDIVIEQMNIWDQMIKLLEESGYEMIVRPQRDIHNHLSIYMDVGLGLGVNTGFLLHDGDNGNMTVIGAVVDGKAINRVRGISGQTSESEQLQTDVLEDQDSQNIYRTRSETLQFRNITQLSVLNQYTQNYLNNVSMPYLDLTVDIFDVGDAFANVRVGNRLIAHASKVHLPGGVVGWRGTVRVLAMALDETKRTIRTTLRGSL
jgi:hypothetical protein